MAQWGRNDQAVTANATTTYESSNGAPIGTWTAVKGDQVNRVDGANAHMGNTVPGARCNTDVAMFNNATPGAFITGMAVGVFGVSAPEQANSITVIEHPAHAGWNLRRAGTGPIIGGSVTTNSGPFKNGETINVSNGAVNGSLVVTTNATGNITSLSVGSGGSGFINTSSLVYAFNHDINFVSAISASGGKKYVSAITVTNANSGYNNLDSIRISNSIVNATATFLTNATGGFVTGNVTISNSGIFANTTLAGNVVFAVVNATGGSTTAGNSSVVAFAATLTTFVALGYNNADIIVISNGITNGYATFITNATGGFTGGGALINVISEGTFANTVTASQVNLSLANATFGATTVGNSISYAFSDTVANSSATATVAATLGGRAGRVHYETLVAMGSLGAQSAAYGTPATANDSTTDNTYFPGT